jgi:hypothetical protein
MVTVTGSLPKIGTNAVPHVPWFTDGTVLRVPQYKAIYLVINHRLELVPNKRVLLQQGILMHQIISIPSIPPMVIGPSL